MGLMDKAKKIVLRGRKVVGGCAEGEALVIDLDPPTTPYWALQLCDRWFQCFPDRRTNLNDRQVVPEPDGSVHLVLTLHDGAGSRAFGWPHVFELECVAPPHFFFFRTPWWLCEAPSIFTNLAMSV